MRDLPRRLKSMNIKDNYQDPETIMLNLTNLNLKNYAGKIDWEGISETSAYVDIIDGRVFKKTALSWYFTKEPTKLSSDRIQRSKNCYAKKKTVIQRLKLSQKYAKKNSAFQDN